MDDLLPPHVVVINDEQALLDLFRDLLEGEGYRVTTRSYPMADVGELLALEPDLVVLDMLFGGEDRGWEFLQQVRLNRAAAAVPIIVCTAAVRMAREAQEYVAGMGIGVILKPFDVDPFLDEVRRRLPRGGGDGREAGALDAPR